MPVFCFGQNIDTLPFPGKLVINFTSWDSAVIRNDTSKVILLFSDIELKEYETTLNVSAALTYKDFDYSTRWMTGYLVRNYYTGTYYLDENKKRLSKNIIVWISKSL